MVTAVYEYEFEEEPVTEVAPKLKLGNKVFRAVSRQEPSRKSSRTIVQSTRDQVQDGDGDGQEKKKKPRVVIKHKLLLKPTLERQKRRKKEKERNAAKTAAAKGRKVDDQEQMKHEKEHELKPSGEKLNTTNLRQTLERVISDHGQSFSSSSQSDSRSSSFEGMDEGETNLSSNKIVKSVDTKPSEGWVSPTSNDSPPVNKDILRYSSLQMMLLNGSHSVTPPEKRVTLRSLPDDGRHQLERLHQEKGTNSKQQMQTVASSASTTNSEETPVIVKDHQSRSKGSLALVPKDARPFLEAMNMSQDDLRRTPSTRLTSKFLEYRRRAGLPDMATKVAKFHVDEWKSRMARKQRTVEAKKIHKESAEGPQPQSLHPSRSNRQKCDESEGTLSSHRKSPRDKTAIPSPFTSVSAEAVRLSGRTVSGNEGLKVVGADAAYDRGTSSRVSKDYLSECGSAAMNSEKTTRFQENQSTKIAQNNSKMSRERQLESSKALKEQPEMTTKVLSNREALDRGQSTNIEQKSSNKASKKHLIFRKQLEVAKEVLAKIEANESKSDRHPNDKDADSSHVSPEERWLILHEQQRKSSRRSHRTDRKRKTEDSLGMYVDRLPHTQGDAAAMHQRHSHNKRQTTFMSVRGLARRHYDRNGAPIRRAEIGVSHGHRTTAFSKPRADVIDLTNEDEEDSIDKTGNQSIGMPDGSASTRKQHSSEVRASSDKVQGSSFDHRQDSWQTERHYGSYRATPSNYYHSSHYHQAGQIYGSTHSCRDWQADKRYSSRYYSYSKNRSYEHGTAKSPTHDGRYYDRKYYEPSHNSRYDSHETYHYKDNTGRKREWDGKEYRQSSHSRNVRYDYERRVDISDPRYREDDRVSRSRSSSRHDSKQRVKEATRRTDTNHSRDDSGDAGRRKRAKLTEQSPEFSSKVSDQNQQSLVTMSTGSTDGPASPCGGSSETIDSKSDSGSITIRSLLELDAEASDMDRFYKRGVALDELMAAKELPGITASLQTVKHLYKGIKIGPVACKIVSDAESKSLFMMQRTVALHMVMPKAHGGLGYTTIETDQVVMRLLPVLGSNLGLDPTDKKTLVHLGLTVPQAIDILPFLQNLEDQVFRSAHLLASKLIMVSAKTSEG